MRPLLLLSVFVGLLAGTAACASVKVVTTLPDYADIARAIGGDQVEVTAIVRGDQDAHFIRPKPSFAQALRKADLLVSTGLDLELWLQTVIDNAGNRRIRSGQEGYVAAATGMDLLEKPHNFSRSEGGVHVYGNPHITTSPINMKVAARNIAQGLIKVDPEHRVAYEENLKIWLDAVDRRLFGNELGALLGGDELCELARKDQLISFLQTQQVQGEPLINQLGGWMKKMKPLRGQSIVTYHKNWIYFVKLFGLQEAGTVEPKPGIPPSPRHVTGLIQKMKTEKLGIILAANYFDQQKIQVVASRTGAKAVIVPLYVGGTKGVDDYFALVDYWIDQLLDAAHAQGMVP
ncbi:MAG: zinc ABC transporter substrate-binding protein [Phycisphaeraceae bacterium]|nr:zinc ABC transporter substrate-binding protein [Phycisphaeraceae bacterium]